MTRVSGVLGQKLGYDINDLMLQLYSYFYSKTILEIRQLNQTVLT